MLSTVCAEARAINLQPVYFPTFGTSLGHFRKLQQTSDVCKADGYRGTSVAPQQPTNIHDIEAGIENPCKDYSIFETENDSCQRNTDPEKNIMPQSNEVIHEEIDRVNPPNKIGNKNNDTEEQTGYSMYTWFANLFRSWWPNAPTSTKPATEIGNTEDIDVEIGTHYGTSGKMCNTKSVLDEDNAMHELENCPVELSLQNEWCDSLERKLNDQNEELNTLTKKNQSLDDELIQLQTKLTKIAKELQTTKQEKDDAQKRCDSLERKLNDQNEELNTLTKKNQSLDGELIQLQTKQTKTAKELQTTKQEKDDAQKRCNSLEHKLNSQVEKLNSFAKKNQILDNEVKQLNKQIMRVEQNLQTTKEEKEEAQKRLSELMSARLRDNNPNIVDLSDQYRPNKLAEMMNELYDNQWTNLFAYIEDEWNEDGEFPERDCTQMLLDVVMEAYTFCSLKMERDYNYSLHQLFGQQITELDPELLKIIKDNRKRHALYTLVQVQKDFIPILKKYGQPSLIFEKASNSDVINEYVQECIKLCWLMVLQDPPVYLVCEGWKSKPVVDKVDDSMEEENDGGDNAVDDDIDDNDNFDDGDGESKVMGSETPISNHESEAGQTNTPNLINTSSTPEHNSTRRKDNLGSLNVVGTESNFTEEENDMLSENSGQRNTDYVNPINDDHVESLSCHREGVIQKEEGIKVNEIRDNIVSSVQKSSKSNKQESIIALNSLNESAKSIIEDKNKDNSDEEGTDKVTHIVGYNSSELKTDLKSGTKPDNLNLDGIHGMQVTGQENATPKTKVRNLTTEPKPKEPFSKDLYREYTKRGPYIDYIVWPVMFLHKDGPLLNKGVAQGCK